VRVGGVALATGAAFGFPEPGHLQRVDRVHDVAGRDQRLHPRATIGLDPGHHLGRAGVLIDVFADHRVQPGCPGDPVGRLRLTQPSAVFVLWLDIVVLLGPVVADERHLLHPLPPTVGNHRRQLTGGNQRPDRRVLQPAHGRARHPISGRISRTTGRGTIST
jgi:hypothetical protein